MTIPPQIGRGMDRVDARAKVTGAARYSAEHGPPGTLRAVLVGARIPRGRITAIDTSAARAAEGVAAVLSHLDLPRVAEAPHLIPSLAGTTAHGQSFFPMQDDRVHYAGQPVALVVADTLERAEYAAGLVDVSYEEEPWVATLAQGRGDAYEPERIFGGFAPGRIERGDVEAGLARADVRIENTHHFAANHHNPIEPSATTAVWEGSGLTLYDSTQGPTATRLTVAQLLGIPPSDVRVISGFVGGSFGSKAMVWAHPTLAAMAARHMRAPVTLALNRAQTFTNTGHREEQEQTITLGATRDGRLTAIRYSKTSPTSPFDDWAEPSMGAVNRMYACPAFEGAHHLFEAATMTPTFMRAPGEATGAFVIETAMDELAHELGMDPIELRLRNHADLDPESGRPWSSKGLRECYTLGAELFGWADRDPAPVTGAARDGHWVLGTGMAGAIYPVVGVFNPQRARARVYADGRAVIETGCSDFGTGAGTVLRQVAADALGLEAEAVTAHYGDTDLPTTVAAVGSAGAGAISAAAHTAATALRERLVAQAVADPGSPLHGADPAAVRVSGGRMVRPDTGAGETYGEMLGRHMTFDAEALGEWAPPEQGEYGTATFGAQFAEVAVDPDLGLVRVRRMLGVFAPGRVLNYRTARSQLMGGMLWGLGQALLEATYMEPNRGRWLNAGLDGYLVPVNADAPDVRVEMIEVEDRAVNPLGVKGVGEIGQVGMAAAIANAVFHATGRRFRDLPITVEAVMAPA
ncbi:xanthine dehydrogenase family protein molybdopterin-binding subunit [Nocardiopsis changdeensis]|uniref:xanthine dehydrogenase family protein molybdopterin-binding subunit n=1 Tax=Nocardiopsis changdeensis TaxID=2831969 RepID=UPI003F4775FA